MKKIGFILIWGAFLAASFVAVLDTLVVKWVWFVPLAVLGFVGVAIVRTGTKQEEQSEHRIDANIQTIHASLEKVITKVDTLNQDRDNINTYDMRHKIDEQILEHINDFVEARETIGHKYGLQEYADVMSHFAAGERYLNRVWSASADGYIDEVATYMDKAEVQFKEAFDQLKTLEARPV